VACYRPLSAYQLDGGEIRFAARAGQPIRRELSLPCGQCIGCRLERSRQWAVRCVHESQMHEHSVFVTLTYNDDHVPVSLDYSDYQKFMKRLRRRFFSPIRFFMAGEYGERFQRPHFHACLFGCFFEDRKLFRRLPNGCSLWTSEVLNELWPFGFASIGDVTFESAAYVARYVTKKVTGPLAESHYRCVDPDSGEVIDRTPEFCHMSLKPGIGFPWYEKYHKEVFPRDEVVMRGKKMRPPRYYMELLRRTEGCMIDDVEFERFKDAMDFVSENTDERLFVRESVAKAKLGVFKRNLE